MIAARSVNHHDLSAHMPGMSTPQGKKRRADRTFRDEQLDRGFFIALLVVHLPPGKVLLSLDRTNWEHGETPINFLVLGAVVHGFTLPLIWVPLDQSGNSHTYARMWLVLKLLRAWPAKRWLGLVADREFIGAEWFRFLRRQGIKRAIRIRQTDMLDDMNGKEWFEHVQHGHFHEIGEKVFVFGELMRVVATRSPTGDLVIIATDFSARKTWRLYKQRWSIECTFSSFKKRGFDLERTGMTERSRLQRLFGLVTLAWMFCLRLGVWLSQTWPIPVLKHGRRAVSLVRHGAQHLVDALRWKPQQFMAILEVFIQAFARQERLKVKLSPTELEAIQQVCVNGQFSAVDLTRELTARKAKGANAVKAYLDWLMNEVRALLEH
ncbi:hypothetical protein DRO_B0005 (plasmid) [Deinococcus radiodurans R1 = ATCC 13939 = DSM 20539]|nr:hypothetical protein DRO_B0005 [Deinococcus radiodurans R1 = ATCC 13939 = DSM 20539]